MTTGTGTPLPEGLGAPTPIGVGLRLSDRYELLHEIATGGMATVYLARARAEGVQGFERVVAIKICHPHLRGEEEFTSMFLDEARLAARIHHPNVVSTLDVSEGAYLYLVMEYIEGDRISGLIKAANKRGERVPIPIALRIMIDVLQGLHAAHELKDAQGNPFNIVHRDVSPQNILVGVDGVSRITDFGIAKAEARLTVTRDGQVKGKMSYMAPEQLQSTGIDRRADVYAAGVVLWETLTGRRLFRADSDAETLNLVLNADVPAPSTVIPAAPPPAPEEETTAQMPKSIPAPPAPPACITRELDSIVSRALERDPEKRFANAEAFAEALENLEGVRVATTRAVAAYINDLLSDQITRRRELLRRLNELGPQVVEHSGVRATGVSNPFATAAGTRTSMPALPPAQAPVPASAGAPMEIEPERPQDSRRGLIVVLALVALFAVIAAVVAVATRRAPAPAPQPVARALTPPPAPTPAPAPAPAPVAPVPEAAPPPSTVAVAPPEVPPAAQPTQLPAPAAAPDNTAVRARGRHGARTVVAGRATGAGNAASAPHTASSGSSSSQGSGEFRPSGI